MTSSMQRFGITLALLGFASILPATVGAQCPAYLTEWGSQGSGDGQFNFPYGVATDAVGDVYVADTANHRILKFSRTGAYITQWNIRGSGRREFDVPLGVATDAAGDVYVSDDGKRPSTTRSRQRSCARRRREPEAARAAPNRCASS